MWARMFFLVSALVVAAGSQARSQGPAGLAAAALADTSFKWIERQASGFRVYFLADSYPAAHQDSLLARLPKALAQTRELIQAPRRSVVPSTCSSSRAAPR